MVDYKVDKQKPTSTSTPPPTTKRTTLARARSGDLRPVNSCGSLCSKYFITVQTSSDWFSGTDNSVYIKLRQMVFKNDGIWFLSRFAKKIRIKLKTNLSGSIKNSDWVKLNKKWYDDFQRGKNDTYVLSFQRALGTIIGIDLKKEGWIGTGLDAWKCSKENFEIKDSHFSMLP